MYNYRLCRINRHRRKWFQTLIQRRSLPISGVPGIFPAVFIHSRSLWIRRHTCSTSGENAFHTWGYTIHPVTGKTFFDPWSTLFVVCSNLMNLIISFKVGSDVRKEFYLTTEKWMLFLITWIRFIWFGLNFAWTYNLTLETSSLPKNC